MEAIFCGYGGIVSESRYPRPWRWRPLFRPIGVAPAIADIRQSPMTLNPHASHADAKSANIDVMMMGMLGSRTRIKMLSRGRNEQSTA